jgi:GNAT superfamily N-acetyltransferase
MRFGAVERLTKAHRTAAFDCGEPVLNEWLTTYAWPAHKGGSASVRVVCEADTLRVVGYYALAMASVTLDDTPRRARAGMPDPVPVVLLARFATDLSVQGRGLGAALLKDVLMRSLSVADEVGTRALVVHAKNEAARRWYEQWDFEPSPTDDLHLWMLMKDIRRGLG